MSLSIRFFFDRAWLVMSLAELGRFDEAAEYEAAAIQLAEETKHAHTLGWAHFAASMLHLLKGDWAKAHSHGKGVALGVHTNGVKAHAEPTPSKKIPKLVKKEKKRLPRKEKKQAKKKLLSK